MMFKHEHTSLLVTYAQKTNVTHLGGKMKKLTVLSLILVVAIALIGCSSGSGDVKLGLGVDTMINKSADLAANDEGVMVGLVQVDTVIAAVAIDKDGKVVSCNIDTAQTEVNFDEAGVITSDKTMNYPTKKEKGADYGMIKASSIGREWFEQAEAVEAWMIGKTAAEITAMPLNDEGVTTDVDLASKATMSLTGYQAAVLEAIKNAR